MSNIFDRVSHYFGQKSIYQYPELKHKCRPHDMEYDLTLAATNRLYDAPESDHMIDWRQI